MGETDGTRDGRQAGDGAAEQSGGGPDGSVEGADDRPRRRSGLTRRRALLLGGGAVVAAGAAAVAAREELAYWWWRLPGNGRPRKEGEVDFPGAEWVAASPANYRRADRPDDYAVDRVVIHVVQGDFATALKVFRDPFHEASAHYVVRRDGHVAQAVRELDVAFHAGNRGYNERSVGIEHEGFVDRPESFTGPLYAASARLTAGICRRYGFPADREHVIGHVEVPGTDHTDPGPHWDWDRYLRLVHAELRKPPAKPPRATPPAAGAGARP
ncbi:N-acetylmuramoyl-L-alanine amidase [Streptomyces sp. GS7]|uniref:N-acetylmuramoyl-L-alanine amidase n=1 Tax=Streptomyces sp. GS7 TaxID=2692234 RepID=UPI001317E665|nr:N-acetylmuramoyl-L-alanine amidase [Streptomyces sp. GS7]QHC25343.1 N-acetylmuramoyl-L-alanine amidase [Streptomyces sp. GS7]